MTLTPVPSRSASPDPARQAPGPAPLPAAAARAAVPAGAGASRLTRTASQANLPSPLAKRPHGAASGSSGSVGSPQRRAPLAALQSMHRSPSPEPLPELDDIAVLPDLTDFPEADHVPRSPRPSLLFSQAETDQITPAGAQAAAAHAAASQAAEVVPYDPLAEPDEVHVPKEGLRLVRRSLVRDEHKTLMASLPTDLSREYRTHVSRFLSHLENKDTSWAFVGAPAVEGDPSKLADLADLVNEVISNKVLHATTRAALKTAFGLELPSTSAVSKLKNEDHKQLMRNLSEDLSKQVRSNVAVFLLHLETQGKNWAKVRACGPNDPDNRPNELEVQVNTGISQKVLHGNTRHALNTAFGLKLQYDKKGVKPSQDAHLTLQQSLPADLSQQYRLCVSKFLIHLESLKSPESPETDWAIVSAYGPNDDPDKRRPAKLEALVNTAISEHGVDKSARAALNKAFGLNLLAPSGRRPQPR
jgi:hypothetical protein